MEESINRTRTPYIFLPPCSEFHYFYTVVNCDALCVCGTFIYYNNYVFYFFYSKFYNQLSGPTVCIPGLYPILFVPVCGLKKWTVNLIHDGIISQMKNDTIKAFHAYHFSGIINGASANAKMQVIKGTRPFDFNRKAIKPSRGVLPKVPTYIIGTYSENCYMALCR